MSLAPSRRLLKQATLLLALLGLVWLGHQAWRGWQFETLFAPEQIAENFRSMQFGQSELGYAYQFWIPQSDEGEFMAIGVYGQFIYVNPTRKVVIAKNSAYINYNVDGDRMEYEALEAFRAISRQVGARGT